MDSNTDYACAMSIVNLHVVLSFMLMMRFELRPSSRLLKGRTLTATLTDDILLWIYSITDIAYVNNITHNHS